MKILALLTLFTLSHVAMALEMPSYPVVIVQMPSLTPTIQIITSPVPVVLPLPPVLVAVPAPAPIRR